MTDKIREEFESWAAHEGFSLEYSDMARGRYFEAETRAAFRGYQAASKANAELVAENNRLKNSFKTIGLLLSAVDSQLKECNFLIDEGSTRKNLQDIKKIIKQTLQNKKD